MQRFDDDPMFERASEEVHAEINAAAERFEKDVTALSWLLARGERLDTVSPRHVLHAHACLRRPFSRRYPWLRLAVVVSGVLVGIARAASLRCCPPPCHHQ